jgi:hypothetical protein
MIRSQSHSTVTSPKDSFSSVAEMMMKITISGDVLQVTELESCVCTVETMQ